MHAALKLPVSFVGFARLLFLGASFVQGLRARRDKEDKDDQTPRMEEDTTAAMRANLHLLCTRSSTAADTSCLPLL